MAGSTALELTSKRRPSVGHDFRSPLQRLEDASRSWQKRLADSEGPVDSFVKDYEQLRRASHAAYTPHRGHQDDGSISAALRGIGASPSATFSIRNHRPSEEHVENPKNPTQHSHIITHAPSRATSTPSNNQQFRSIYTPSVIHKAPQSNRKAVKESAISTARQPEAPLDVRQSYASASSGVTTESVELETATPAYIQGQAGSSNSAHHFYSARERARYGKSVVYPVKAKEIDLPSKKHEGTETSIETCDPPLQQLETQKLTEGHLIKVNRSMTPMPSKNVRDKSVISVPSHITGSEVKSLQHGLRKDFSRPRGSESEDLSSALHRSPLQQYFAEIPFHRDDLVRTFLELHRRSAERREGIMDYHAEGEQIPSDSHQALSSSFRTVQFAMHTKESVSFRVPTNNNRDIGYVRIYLEAKSVYALNETHFLEEAMKSVRREKALGLKGPFIVHASRNFQFEYLDHEYSSIVLFNQGYSLEEVINVGQYSFLPSNIYQIMKGLISGTQFLERKKYSHGNIRPEAFMIRFSRSKNPEIVISDFRWTQKLGSKRVTQLSDESSLTPWSQRHLLFQSGEESSEHSTVDLCDDMYQMFLTCAIILFTFLDSRTNLHMFGSFKDFVQLLNQYGPHLKNRFGEEDILNIFVKFMALKKNTNPISSKSLIKFGNSKKPKQSRTPWLSYIIQNHYASEPRHRALRRELHSSGRDLEERMPHLVSNSEDIEHHKLPSKAQERMMDEMIDLLRRWSIDFPIGTTDDSNPSRPVWNCGRLIKELQSVSIPESSSRQIAEAFGMSKPRPRTVNNREDFINQRVLFQEEDYLERFGTSKPSDAVLRRDAEMNANKPGLGTKLKSLWRRDRETKGKSKE